MITCNDSEPLLVEENDIRKNISKGFEGAHNGEVSEK